ncbi:MAG: hypothetical protein WD270_05490 [Acetobacterales bacterium]
MTALPTKSHLDGSGATPTEGQFKTAIGALYDYVKERLEGGSASRPVAPRDGPSAPLQGAGNRRFPSRYGPVDPVKSRMPAVEGWVWPSQG